MSNNETHDAQVARRLVVELNHRSVRDLTSAMTADGTNRTTTVNRAIQVYEMVRATQADGGYIVRVQPDGTQERVMLL
jgi:arginine repressor